MVSPPKPWVCPSERRVTVVPQALKKQLGAATTTAEVKKLLAPLQLGLPWDAEACTKAETPAAVKLDVFRARIISADTEDLVLQARGKVCEYLTLLAGAVLHPLGEKNTYCLTKMPFLPGMETSYSNFPPEAVFAFENLTDPVRQAFKVDAHQGDVHGESNAISFWEAEAGSLVELFKLEWTDGAFTVFSSSSEVTIRVEGKEFPRQLRLEEATRSCGTQTTLPSGELVVDSECSEASSESVYCYKRTRPDVPAAYEKCGERRSLD
ncbi:hypothetical protein LZ198_40490 [Myxococcus sp. K15C18031901]|uniref:hypothetical protein n=1 Tax=Myxococcus dinghuensis TaxID=2906761 RepID=UPI0020A7407C|nr:hypothetical protein [Myxococcus dinghuensis]MCP3105166.1 hypothetical protein [Myxococcus dinghuensis]